MKHKHGKLCIAPNLLLKSSIKLFHPGLIQLAESLWGGERGVIDDNDSTFLHRGSEHYIHRNMHVCVTFGVLKHHELFPFRAHFPLIEKV